MADNNKAPPPPQTKGPSNGKKGKKFKKGGEKKGGKDEKPNMKRRDNGGKSRGKDRRKDPPKVIIRNLPPDLSDLKLFEQGIHALVTQAQIPKERVRAINLCHGKVSKRRGMVPGVGYLTCSSSTDADTICSLLPEATPLLLRHFQPKPTDENGLPLPTPPPSQTTSTSQSLSSSTSGQGARSSVATPSIRPLHEERLEVSQNITATRAIYTKIMRISNKRDRQEGTIQNDADFLNFLKKLEAPVEKLPSAAEQVDRKLAMSEAEKKAGSTLVSFLVKQAASKQVQALSRKGLPTKSSGNRQSQQQGQKGQQQQNQKGQQQQGQKGQQQQGQKGQQQQNQKGQQQQGQKGQQQQNQKGQQQQGQKGQQQQGQKGQQQQNQKGQQQSKGQTGGGAPNQANAGGGGGNGGPMAGKVVMLGRGSMIKVDPSALAAPPVPGSRSSKINGKGKGGSGGGGGGGGKKPNKGGGGNPGNKANNQNQN